MCFVLASLIYSFFYMTRPSAMFPIKIYMRRQGSCVGLLITFSFPFWSCLYFLQLCNIQVVITRNIVCSPCSRGGSKIFVVYMKSYTLAEFVICIIIASKFQSYCIIIIVKAWFLRCFFFTQYKSKLFKYNPR